MDSHQCGRSPVHLTLYQGHELLAAARISETSYSKRAEFGRQVRLRQTLDGRQIVRAATFESVHCFSFVNAGAPLMPGSALPPLSVRDSAVPCASSKCSHWFEPRPRNPMGSWGALVSAFSQNAV